MVYIKRRLSIFKSAGNESVSEDEFLRMPGLKVVLGEPGAGKSEFAGQLASEGGEFHHVSAVMHRPGMIPAGEGRFLIFDGVDEVTAYQSEPAAIGMILSKIDGKDFSSCVFTCRSADWKNFVASNLIANLGGTLVVGTLYPLADKEIIEFIDSNFSSLGGRKFLEAAKRWADVELLRNPQMLGMFAEIVERTGIWPKTRTALYEGACKGLVTEVNRRHMSYNQLRPKDAAIIEIAGAIYAQLIMGDKRAVDLEGNSREDVLSIQDLSSAHLSIPDIRAALGTKLFRSGGEPGTLVPCHRTVAEFLAGKWIVKRIAEGLSVRRLRAFFHSAHDVVPPALRGLHAWIAILHVDPVLVAEFIRRDPYGVLLYGDSERLSPGSARHLLAALKRLAQENPRFRENETQKLAGKGIVRLELKNEILEILRTPAVGFEFRRLILEQVKGEVLADEILEQVIDMVADRSLVVGSRLDALRVLLETNADDGFISSIHDKLLGFGEVDSLRVAMAIVGGRASSISVDKIMQNLFDINFAVRSSRSPLVVGTGSGIAKKMSDEQLIESLFILEFVRTDPSASRDDAFTDFRVQTLQQVFDRDLQVDADILWQGLLESYRRKSYYREGFEGSLGRYFDRHAHIRRAVQVCALASEQPSVRERNSLDRDLKSMSMQLTKDDEIFHLDRIFSGRDENPHWSARWREIVRPGVGVSGDEALVLEYAARQVEAYPDLLAFLNCQNSDEVGDDVLALPAWGVLNPDASRKERYEQYESLQAEILAGTHMDAIQQIVLAFLGQMSEIKGDTGPERVVDLVGPRMTSYALGAVGSMLDRADVNVPTTKEIGEILAANRVDVIALACLVHCCVVQGEYEVPEHIARAALACSYWVASGEDDESTERTLEALESRNLGDKELKRAFLTDCVEPFLRKGEGVTSIPNLERFCEHPFYAEVIGEVALKWISSSEYVLSKEVLVILLRAVVGRWNIHQLRDLAQKRVLELKGQKSKQLAVWIGVWFMLDFERNAHSFSNFVVAGEATREGFSEAFYICKQTVLLSPSQNYFLISQLGARKDYDTIVGGISSIELDISWGLKDWLEERVEALSASFSPDATVFLEKLVGENWSSTRFHDVVRHRFSQHKAMLADSQMKTWTFDSVVGLLWSGAPENHEDMQAVLQDELEEFQKSVSSSPTDDYAPYWNGDVPFDENYCRNRIASALTHRLSRHGIQFTPEGAMPAQMRCDILYLLNGLRMPVEIKGQWHRDVWTAPAGQLQDYMELYGAEGYGIYVVLFFGDTGKGGKKKVTKSPGGKRPESAAEFLEMLTSLHEGKISPKTKLFVLDLSKPSSVRGSGNRPGGKVTVKRKKRTSKVTKRRK